MIYDNISSRNEIAVIDLARHTIVGHYALKGCHEPTGLAYDSADDLLISVCRNGAVKILDAKTGDEAASFMVGKGT